MSMVFYWILNMSIVAVVSGAIVMLIRSIKKIPRRYIFVLWIIPFLRLCLPFGMSSKYSLMTLLNNLLERAVAVKVSESELFKVSVMNSIQAVDTYHPFRYKSIVLEKVFNIGAVCWIVVAVVLLLFFAVVYIRNIVELKATIPYKDNIYLSERIDTPCVVGIIRPRIMLPTHMEINEYVIAHEKAHIKNADNLWRVVAILVAIVHWFNPFVWLFLKMFFADMEKACDERVLVAVGEENRKAYAYALVGCAEQKNVFASALSGGNVRSRIENIISYKKLTVFAVLALGGFCVAVAFVLLTNSL